MRLPRLLALVPMLAFLSAGSLQADEIFLRNKQKPLLGTIVNEGGYGVSLENVQENVPAASIVDIRYEKRAGDPSTNLYFEARAKDKEAHEKPKGRKDNLFEAVGLYEKTLREIPKGAEHNYVRRHIEFRIAFLRSELTTEFKESPKLAMTTLKAFKTKNLNSWQISYSLQALASLQAAQSDFAGAEKTYAELGQAPVADEVKLEAEFLSAQLGIRAGNLEQALARLEALAAKLPKDSPVAPRVLITQAECLALAKKSEQAGTLLRKMLKESSDRNLKAMAHNALGKILFDQDKFKEARWEFLWVDVIYNQDKAEHARALYYLWQAFDKLGETERAVECRDALLGEQFAGTDYQRLAQKMNKK